MSRNRIVCVWLGLLVTLMACQPQVLLVEVTRPVEGMAETSSNPSDVDPMVVEVTRITVQEVTRVVPEEVEVEVEVTAAPPGSAERPIQLLLPPVAESAAMMSRLQPLVTYLEDKTHRDFEVGILDNEENVVSLLCAAPAETVGFLTAAGFVQANTQCGAQAATVAVNEYGLTWQAGMLVVRRDSGISDLTDLTGQRWAVPDEESIANYRYFQAMLAAAGVEVAEIVTVPGDNTAMLAVLQRQADFATGSYLPPILPYDERAWIYGEDDPELWRQTGYAATRSGIGFIIVYARPEFGGYRIRDARAGIFDTNPTVFAETHILTLGAPIPNETIAFGAEFPVGLARELTELLTEFANSDACSDSLCAADFYGWAGLQPAEDSDYDPLRFVQETLNP